MRSRSGLLLTLFFSSVCVSALAQDFDLPSNFNVPTSQFDLPFFSESLSLGPPLRQEAVSAIEKSLPESREDLLEIQEAAIAVAAKARQCTVALQLAMRWEAA